MFVFVLAFQLQKKKKKTSRLRQQNSFWIVWKYTIVIHCFHGATIIWLCLKMLSFGFGPIYSFNIQKDGIEV